jgi:hypothetical protein
MVPAFVKLLKDTEAEVRTAIAGQIPGRFFMSYDYDVKIQTDNMNRILQLDRPRYAA